MQLGGGICSSEDGIYVFNKFETYVKYADLRKKCKKKPDYDF
tara:strand:- start:127 stop:252 length:126 start_codon:yes stop_codon:yes gene_type:complete